MKERVYRDGEVLICPEQGRTQQSSAAECDINLIVANILRGSDVPMKGITPMFGDFTALPDLRGMMVMVTKAKEAFAALDSRVRERFHNDPAALVEFLNDDRNRDEAIRLGLVNPTVVEAVKPLPADSGASGEKPAGGSK